MVAFETAQMFEESDTDSCFPFFPAVFEYSATTFEIVSLVVGCDTMWNAHHAPLVNLHHQTQTRNLPALVAEEQ